MYKRIQYRLDLSSFERLDTDLSLLRLLYRPQVEYNVQINTNYKYDNKFLNSSIVFASMSSSGRAFHSLIADGKNECL